MSKLGAFLNPIATEETKEVLISKRFQADGKPVPFTIKSISQEENDHIAKLSTKREKVHGQIIESLDNQAYQNRLVLACVVEPDLQSKELCDAYNCIDPMRLPGKMLFPGEYAQLLNAITDINGVKDSEELANEAKNF